MGPSDDDEGLEVDASNEDNNDSDGLADDTEDGEVEDDGEGDGDDATLDYPNLDWGPKALNKWRDSEFDGGTWPYVKWLGEDRAKIIKKSRPK
jgi:hypothetical protein